MSMLGKCPSGGTPLLPDLLVHAFAFSGFLCFGQHCIGALEPISCDHVLIIKCGGLPPGQDP